VRFSVVVPAYNEAANIETVLTSLLKQETRHAQLTEIIVVASGCTDDTADKAKAVGRGKPGVHVHVQERRAGKVAAINHYLRVRDPRAEIIVCTSADLRIEPDVLERIAEYFSANPDVGMVGARPVPDNDGKTIMGRMVQLIWDMHHRISLHSPKMGELVAFRANLVEQVSELSVVDEASVEDIVRSKGKQLGYVPEARVINHGPERWEEFFEQRRRIARGHFWLSFAFGYRVASLDHGLVATTLLEVAKDQDGFGRAALMIAVGTEALARAAGFFDARVVGGKHRTWTPLASTKVLKGNGGTS
jgi:poly-beta-1,6-N-acetyl-D-glucosamine synthase